MTAPAYPRVSPCRHCGLAVLRDNDRYWIHANLSYLCRDRAGELRGSDPDPEPTPRPCDPSGTVGDRLSWWTASGGRSARL